jgi:serine protease Do
VLVACCVAIIGATVASPLQAQVNVRVSHGSEHGWIGIYFPKEQGSHVYPVIASVEPNSPAQAAGLQAGDTLLGFNDVDARGDLHELPSLLKPGAKVNVRIRRNGARTVSVTVGKRFSQSFSVTWGRALDTLGLRDLLPLIQFAPHFEEFGADGHAVPVAGADMGRMNADLADVLGIPNQGVFVLNVAPGTPAKEAGLKGGDVIVKADTLVVSSPVEVMKAIAVAGDRSVELRILRKGRSQKVTLRW